jgi:hypothetical protein
LVTEYVEIDFFPGDAARHEAPRSRMLEPDEGNGAQRAASHRVNVAKYSLLPNFVFTSKTLCINRGLAGKSIRDLHCAE